MMNRRDYEKQIRDNGFVSATHTTVNTILARLDALEKPPEPKPGKGK